MFLTLFTVISILCILIYFYLLAILHQKNRGIYNPIWQAVSDYGVGKFKIYFKLAGFFTGLRNICLALSLFLWPYQFPFKTRAIILLLLTLLGYIGVALFPTDLEGEPRTWKGRCHLLFAIFQFTTLVLVLLNFADALRPLPGGFYQLARWLKLLLEVGLYGLVAAMVLPFLKKYFGLFERVFLLANNLYFLLICFAILSCQLAIA